MNSIQTKGASMRTATSMPFFQAGSSFALLISLLILSGLPHLAKASSPTPNHTVVIQLNSEDAGKILVTAEDLFVGIPGFEGMQGETVLDPVAQTLTYSLSGSGGVSLPANQAIALLKLEDPSNGAQHDFLLKTDGGGIIMVLDDF